MGKGKSFDSSYATPVIGDPDNLEEVFQHYNPDNLPSTQILVQYLPERLSKLIPSEFSVREQNFHIFFFLWYEQQNRLPASLPKIAQEYTNFYSLYRIVTLKMGGFMKISHSKDGEWAAIWKNSPNYSSNATSSASSRVKSTYSRFLYPFEKIFHKKCKIFTWKLYRRGDSNALQDQILSDTISSHDEVEIGKSADQSPEVENGENGENGTGESGDVGETSSLASPESAPKPTDGPAFTMETTWKLFESRLAQAVIGTAHEVHVDMHFMYFTVDSDIKIDKDKVQKKKQKKKVDSSDDETEEPVPEEPVKDSANTIDPYPKGKNHVGDILYSSTQKLIRLVIANDAPVDNDFIVVGRLTPSADFTKDDIFSYLSTIDVPQLIKNSNKRKAAKKKLDSDLLLSIKFHEVTIEQHSRPHNSTKRKRKSPKKNKKSKRIKTKEGREKKSKEPTLFNEEEDEDDYYEMSYNPPTRSTRAANRDKGEKERTKDLEKEHEKADIASESSEYSGIDQEVMTNISKESESEFSLPGIFFLRYKFNNDPDDDYRVIHIPLSEITNGRLTLQKLMMFMQRDNVSMDAISEIRYMAHTVTNDNLGWVRVTENWNYRFDVPLKQNLSIWLLTKRGYIERYGS